MVIKGGAPGGRQGGGHRLHRKLEFRIATRRGDRIGFSDPDGRLETQEGKCGQSQTKEKGQNQPGNIPQQPLFI